VRIRPGGSDLVAQRGLARAVVLDRRVLGDGRDRVGDPVAEAPSHLVEARVGVLDDVVQQPAATTSSSNTAAREQRGHLQRVQR
jgi:hypothetical protein